MIKTDKKGWIVRLVSCLLFFLAFNAFMGIYFKGKEVRFYNARLGQRMKYFNQYELDAAINRVAKDQGPKILVLGDSFVWGTGLSDNQTFSAELEKYLAGRIKGKKYHVYNLSIPASNAADVYAVLKQAGPLKPDLIILNTNYFFFSAAEPLAHMNYLWLTANLSDEPDRNRLIQRLNIFTPEVRLGEIIRRNLPLYRYREEINIKLFGTNKPQNKFTERLNSGVLSLRWRLGLEKKWKPKPGKETGESLGWAYSPNPVTPDRANYIFSEKIAAYLKNNRLNAAIFVTPHNANVVGKFMAAEGFKKNNQVISDIFTKQNLPLFNYEERLGDNLQSDHVHLSREGSTVFARLLADDITPLLAKTEGN